MYGNAASKNAWEGDNCIDAIIPCESTTVPQTSEITPVPNLVVRKTMIDRCPFRIGEMAAGTRAGVVRDITVGVDVHCLETDWKIFNASADADSAGATSKGGGEEDGSNNRVEDGGLDLAYQRGLGEAVWTGACVKEGEEKEKREC